VKRDDLIGFTKEIYKIADHSERFVPVSMRGVAEFRAELGGLMTVLIASSYENIVKQVLVDYAARHNVTFGRFTESAFDRIDSRIKISDLHKYCKHGGPDVSKAFKLALSRRRKLYQTISRVEFDKSYELILKWRHAYAHAGKKNTSLEEAIKKHKEGFPVLLAFAEAFEANSP
jgi:BMFP domain-containing protein YqiC